MNASDLVAELESRFCCVQGPYRHKCQTGEAYVTIGFEDWSRGGTVADPASLGDSIPGVIRNCAPRRHFLTEDEACCAFLEAFALYEKHWKTLHDGEPAPIVYWRYDPPIHFYPAESYRGFGKNRTPLGAVKCRLVLSNLPVVDVGDAEYDAARRSQLEREILGGHDV